MISKILKHFFILLCLTQSLSAQYIFDNIKTKDGLSYKNVRSILHDSQGYYWFGTANGLNRFDGSGIKVFNETNKNTQGLRSTIINSIVENTDGKIWLATSAAVTIFDNLKLTFTGTKGNIPE